ncbi:MAG: methyltransferase domain-containing protein [Limisphaerales bacterium]
MTEWDASNYARRSALQETMAAQVLALLKFTGRERVLDIGCGDGRITAEIATRLPHGSILGVDASLDMISFAAAHAVHPNLKFEVANAAELPFRDEFDLILSFNALHWLPQQDAPLRCIHAALKPNGKAQLRLVVDGEHKSLETVLEETRKSARWAEYFEGFYDPYLHINQEQYARLAERNGFRVDHIHTALNSWDFQSRENFVAFGQVTFVEWTRRLPDAEKAAFISDVLDRYATATANLAVPASKNSVPHIFHFYQMDVTLSPV